MEEIEKQILLSALCAMVPYDTKVNVKGVGDFCLDSVSRYGEIGIDDHTINLYPFYDVKPYLRFQKDMTDEEWKTLQEINSKYLIFSSKHLTYHIDKEVTDYLDSIHVDYRHLIDRGLALEAPEGMYTVLCRNINAKTDIREKTPFFDKNGVRIYEGDVFVYLKYTNFKDGVPSDLIENYSKYENEVMLHPVFWYDKEKSWCSDVYGDCDYMASYDFNEVVVVTNKGEHPELYNY